MTGYTVHTGSNEKFTAGWDQIFGGTPKKKSPVRTSGRKTRATKKKKRKSH